MAICQLCRFYNYTMEQVGQLTLQEFTIMNKCMIEILEMENPNPNKKGSGEVGYHDLKKLTGKK